MLWKGKIKKLELLSKNQNKGFIIIETILAMAIFSLLIISLLNTLTLLLKSKKSIDDISINNTNLNHSYEYIIKEIEMADGLFETIHIKDFNKRFNNNIGFIIKSKSGNSSNENSGKEIYNYSSYYINNGNLIRVATNLKSSVIPSASDFAGYNKLMENVLDFHGTKVNLSDKYINLKINTKVENKLSQRHINLEFKELSHE